MSIKRARRQKSCRFLYCFTFLVVSFGALGSPDLKRTVRRLFEITPPASPEVVRRITPQLLQDLGQAYKDLRSGNHAKAIIISPYVTIKNEIEAAARAGTDVVIITTPAEAQHISGRLAPDLLGGKIVIRQSPSGKLLHDKAILLLNQDGSWNSYLGSANASYNQFRSNELVTRLTNIGISSPKLIEYIQRLSRISQSPHVIRRSRPGEGRRRMQQTMQQLQIPHDITLSSQEVSSFVEDDPVAMILGHISPTEVCNYKISSMGFNHTGVIPVLKKALKIGSNIQFLLDEGSVHRAQRNPRSEISKLIQLQQEYPETLQIRTNTGKGKTGIHHVKLFIRECDDDTFLSHMTHNLTAQAARQTNYALTITSWPPSNWQRIREYIKQFDSLWETAITVGIP